MKKAANVHDRVPRPGGITVIAGGVTAAVAVFLAAYGGLAVLGSSAADLAEEGHDVQVRPNPETGWDVAVISANEAPDAGIRAEVIAAGLRRRYDLEK